MVGSEQTEHTRIERASSTHTNATHNTTQQHNNEQQHTGRHINHQTIAEHKHMFVVFYVFGS
jgi:hypothetical protein